MKKLVALLICSTLYLTGCTKEYTKTDVEKFVIDETHQKDYKVCAVPEEVRDKEGYTDYLWCVNAAKTNFKFSVLDNYGWGMESVDNYLMTDYPEAVLHYMKPHLPELKHFTIETSLNEYGMYQGGLSCDFADREELRACYDELQLIQKRLADFGFENVAAFYVMRYKSPLRNQLLNYEQQSGEIVGRINDNKAYVDLLNRYIRTVLDYRYNVIETFTAEEIANALEGYEGKVGLYTGTQTDRNCFERDKVRYYDNIVGHDPFSITFGSLYEILQQEGFAPSGNSWHYTFVGTNNDIYEVSYDFCDYDVGDKSGYYYLKNEEPIPMQDGKCNYFSVFEIEEMTGLKLVAHQLK